MQWGKDDLFNKFCSIVRIVTQKKFLNSTSHMVPKINFKCSVDLNDKDKTIHFLQSNTEKYLHHLGEGTQRFLKPDTTSTNHREKNDKPDNIKMKNLKDLYPK